MLLVIAVGASAALADEPARSAKPLTREQAETTARKWLDSLDMEGLVIDETIKEGGFVGQAIIGSESYMYLLQRDGWQLTLGFAGKIDKTTPIDEARAKFKYIALDRVPTPGLVAPGWEVFPQTPVSSFRDGVELVSLEQGVLKIHVQTNFFAIYGRNPSVPLASDAPAPKDAYFQLREKLLLDLTLSAPLSVK
jgi:hypothetical protein